MGGQYLSSPRAQQAARPQHRFPSDSSTQILTPYLSDTVLRLPPATWPVAAHSAPRHACVVISRRVDMYSDEGVSPPCNPGACCRRMSLRCPPTTPDDAPPPAPENELRRYCLHVLQPPSIAFSSHPTDYTVVSPFTGAASLSPHARVPPRLTLRVASRPDWSPRSFAQTGLA